MGARAGSPPTGRASLPARRLQRRRVTDGVDRPRGAQRQQRDDGEREPGRPAHRRRACGRSAFARGKRRREAPGYSSWNEVRGSRKPPRRKLAARRRRRTPGALPLTTRHAQSSRRRDQPLPPPARAQPGGLVSVGTGGARAGARRGQADPAQHRLRGVSLVPRHGARVVRGRGDRRADERALRLHQGGPRGAARPRRDLHAGDAGDDRTRRLADDRVPHAGGRAVLRRHVLPARRPARHAVRSAACSPASPTRGATGRTSVARTTASMRELYAASTERDARRRARSTTQLLARAVDALRAAVTSRGSAASAARRSSRRR